LGANQKNTVAIWILKIGLFHLLNNWEILDGIKVSGVFQREYRRNPKRKRNFNPEF